MYQDKTEAARNGQISRRFRELSRGALPPCTPWDLAHSALKNCIHKTGSGSMSTAGRRKGATLGSDSPRRVSARENCTRGRFRPLQHSTPHDHTTYKHTTASRQGTR
jgi:hypothetical protein